jgi:hypothetical protein
MNQDNNKGKQMNTDEIYLFIAMISVSWLGLLMAVNG